MLSFSTALWESFCFFPASRPDSLHRRFAALMSFSRGQEKHCYDVEVFREIVFIILQPRALSKELNTRSGERNSCCRNLNQEQSRGRKKAVATLTPNHNYKKRIQMVINYTSGSVNGTKPAVRSSGLKTLCQCVTFPRKYCLHFRSLHCKMGLSLPRNSRPKEFEMTCNFFRYIHGLRAVVLKEPLVYFTWLFSNLKLLK